jgi:hypothetical protein
MWPDTLVGLATDGASFDPSTDPTLYTPASVPATTDNSSAWGGVITSLGNTASSVLGTWATTQIQTNAYTARLRSQQAAGLVPVASGGPAGLAINPQILLLLVAAVVLVIVMEKH